MIWAILLLVLSLVLIFAEVLFPSFGVLGIGAIVTLVGAIVLAFREGTTEGFIFLIASLACCFGSALIAIRILPLTPFGKKLFLIGPEPTPEERRGVDSRLNALVGNEGISKTVLRPAGIAEIEGRRVDVVTLGEPIEANVKIRVVQVDGNRVVVSLVSKNS